MKSRKKRSFKSINKPQKFILGMFIGILFALLLESIVVFSHCEYRVAEVFVGESVLNGSYDLSYYGYEQVGQSLHQINEDPQIYVTNLNKNIHSIEIKFAECFTETPVIIVYYPDKNGNLDEDHKAFFEYFPEAKRAVAEIPSTNYSFIRLDINADFQLADVQISSRSLYAIDWQANFNNYNIGHILLFFAICLLSYAIYDNRERIKQILIVFGSSIAQLGAKIIFWLRANSKKICLLLVLLIFSFFIETIFVFFQTEYIRDIVDGETVLTEKANISVYGYKKTDNEYIQKNKDPQIYINNLNTDICSIKIQFENSFADKPFIRVYYPDKRGVLNEKNACNIQYYYEDTNYAVCEIPYNNYPFIRIDINNDFLLKDIQISSQTLEKHIDFENTLQKYSFLQVGMIFLVLMLLTALWYKQNNLQKMEAGHGASMRKSLLALLPMGLITFVFCFMLFIYEPIFMYATNMNDFWFDFGIMIKPSIKIFALFFLACCLVFVAIFTICKLVKNKIWIYNGLVILFFLIFVVTYIQGNWLVSSLPGLDGTEINWDSLGKTEDLIAVLIFSALGITATILILKFNSERIVKWCSVVSLVLFIMLLSSLTSVVLNNDALKNKNGIILTMTNFNTVSENKNFFIFLIDSVQSQEMEELLNNSAEYKKVFEDFTFFTDAMSVYPFTQYSIPFILSGNMAKNDKEFSEYSTEAYNDSKLFPILVNNDYDLNLYSSGIVWNGNRKYDIKNASSTNNANLIFEKYKQEAIKWISFKYLPYVLKEYSSIETLNFNKCIEKFYWEDTFIYDTIVNNPLLQKDANNVFHFIHTEGAHSPFNYDRDLNVIKNGTYSQKAEACITMIDAYLRRLKDNGVYDNSIIIVMADHGIGNRLNPALFVKGFNENHLLITSDVPVSYFDLIDACSALLTGKKSTDLFNDINIPRNRKFIWYTWANDSHMVEYETDGTARDWQSFRETGNVYDR